MRNILLCLIASLFALPAISQSEIEPPIADQFDVVTLDWIEKSGQLKTYEGISGYCKDPNFRKSVNRLLSTIHSYDSLIISKLDDATYYLNWDKKEEKKTLSDIGDLETVYGAKQFDNHMRETCAFRREIENDKQNLKNGVGAESYDAQVLLLEQSQVRYFKKIDKLVLKIDEHLHVLNIDK